MRSLKVIQPTEPPAGVPPAGSPSSRAHPPAGSWWMPWLTRLYRLAIIILIVWLIHDLRTSVRFHGDAPIKVEEARAFFPTAASLEIDESPYGGLHVLDAAENRVGYVLRTSPYSDKITGYVGTTDTLVALDPQMKVVGIRVRTSQDTKEHVADVTVNDYFMTFWNGKTWEEVAQLDPAGYKSIVRGKERIVEFEGVSGSTLTSRAMAGGIHLRFKSALDAAAIPTTPPLRFGWHDLGVVLIILIALAFAFTPLKSKPWARRVFQFVIIGYLGFINGQILAQSLFAGWSASNVPWRLAPGLALLVAAALIIPWATRRQIYCSHLCPHGAAQEWVGRLRKKKLTIPRSIEKGLRWLPGLLIVLVIFVTMMQLPFDLAGIEPFDAYMLRMDLSGATLAGWATVGIAIVGLIVAAFVPMAYCKYGCPTGLLLSFVRSHGKADHFGKREVAAGLIVLMVVGIHAKYETVHRAIYGPPAVAWQPTTNTKMGKEAQVGPPAQDR